MGRMIYGAKAFISRARVDSCCEIDKFVSNVTSLFYYYVDGCIDGSLRGRSSRKL